MPTLAWCGVLCSALVLSVALQAPAVSTGLRWTPGPPRRTLTLPPVEPFAIIEGDWDRQSNDHWRRWLVLAVAVLLTGVLVYGAWRWFRHWRRAAIATHVVRLGVDTRVSGEVHARVLQSGLVAAMEVLDTERDPGNAVVRAWQGLQDAAASAGVMRRPAETASEFTARILFRSQQSAAPIAVLLTLYQRVRFGEHTPTAQEIAAAQDALTVLVQLWQGDLAVRRHTIRPK